MLAATGFDGGTGLRPAASRWLLNSETGFSLRHIPRAEIPALMHAGVRAVQNTDSAPTADRASTGTRIVFVSARRSCAGQPRWTCCGIRPQRAAERATDSVILAGKHPQTCPRRSDARAAVIAGIRRRNELQRDPDALYPWWPRTHHLTDTPLRDGREVPYLEMQIAYVESL